MIFLESWVIDMLNNFANLAADINREYGFAPDCGGYLITFSQNKSGDTFSLGSNAVVTTKRTTKVQRIYIKNNIFKSADFDFTSVLPGAKLVELSSDPQYTKIETQLENDLIDCIRPYLEQAIKDYKPIKTFACCSRYVECSDAKKCLHPQQIYAKQCWYRDNLENGLIFYGKGANV